MIRFNWARLTSSDFEELCKELLMRRGFRKVVRMSGPGSGDRGRDLHAEEYLVSGTGQSIFTKALVQCKNYWGSKTTIGPDEVEKTANRAKTLGYNRVLIITSHDLSAAGKTAALDIANSPQWGVNVEWLTEYDLSTLLLEYPDLATRFELKRASGVEMEIAVLSGYVSDKSHRCESAFSRVSPEDWKKLLASKNMSVSLIRPTEIKTIYDAVVNPFGEVYPEEEPNSGKTYRRILEYIDSGGVFVNTGGFPFFYYWDGIRGSRHIATRSTMKIVRETGILDYFSWSDTSFYRDFKQALDTGNPREVTIFQTQDDKRYVGDLLSVGTRKIRQFRSVTSRGTAIPLLRARKEETYPLAAIRHGHGYLIVAGLDLDQKEARLVALATKNWILSSGGSLRLKH